MDLVYLIGIHDVIHLEHGYAHLGETIFFLQMEPPEFWSLGSLVWYVDKD